MDGGLEESNFKVFGKLYSEAMRNLGIKDVPILAAEDETAILGQISYSESSDELLGFAESAEQITNVLTVSLSLLAMAYKATTQSSMHLTSAKLLHLPAQLS